MLAVYCVENKFFLLLFGLFVVLFFNHCDAQFIIMCSGLLEDCKFASDRAKSLTAKYLEHKSVFRSSLGRICSSPPHLTDVQWRLDYYLKVMIALAFTRTDQD